MVRSGEVAKVRVPLEVGSVSQTVTVSSGADTYLDTASAQVATSLDALTIQSLPTLDRDPVALANITPGVVPVSRDNLNFFESVITTRMDNEGAPTTSPWTMR